MSSPVNFAVQQLQQVSVVEASGRIDSTNAAEFERTLNALMQNGHHHIVLNLNNVNYMSSAGLRTMVSVLRTCKKHGGDMRIATPSERVREVINLAGLETIFKMYDDQVSAVGSY